VPNHTVAPVGPMSLRYPLRMRAASAIVEQLTRGLSADQIALTAAVGLCIAIIPVVGVTTILSFAAAWALRLNQPIIQFINWTSYPLQLLLILPFIRLGERFFRAARLRLSLEDLVAFAKADPWGAMASLWTTVWHAVAVWAVVTPLLGALVFFAARPLIRSLARRVAAARAKIPGEMAFP
jgi:uncharacterized protein (DUF2062 family)